MHLKSILACLVLATTLSHADSYQSGQHQVQLLELYTSEGCSSCPPADHWLSRQQQHPGLWKQFVPVAFHVAYWDWIGWQDPYASEKYDKRQRTYASTGAVGNVYTPGFLLNGREWRGFFQHERTLPKALKRDVGNLQLTIDGKQFEASFNGEKAQQLHIAILGMELTSQVTKGENRNKTLKHDFVVIGFGSYPMSAGKWHGRLPMLMHESERYGIAAWVTDGKSQQPIQALGGGYAP
ncbi:DUF1223 domain-containing protein [Porticoccus sp. W117]|uniref:DUF1223 domain-containing protein n=1 Tax=Porticoccus sp. W117 TaxID=3054777 RepID=UPI0025950305|nr:DUF1223 domain-containing protein [Porticoccus sp. W117]MDM3870677.1 DUF1223 domain-containing protein [Porticoccus sp. W117]